MSIQLSKIPIFPGIEEPEIASLLQCLQATERTYQKGETILSEGSVAENMGIVLSGMALISCGDIWGNTSVLGHVTPGAVFAEVYACIPGEPLLITVSAAEDTTVLFMNVGRILSTCTNDCPFHTRLARNLLADTYPSRCVILLIFQINPRVFIIDIRRSLDCLLRDFPV